MGDDDRRKTMERRTDGKTYFGVSSPPYPALTWYVPISTTTAFTSSAMIDQKMI